MADSNVKSAPKCKLYYLEKDKQFWEISAEGETTTIRFGKKGCKGRKYPAKQHPSAAKATKHALLQVNSKIMQGFEEPSTEKTQTAKVASFKSPGLPIAATPIGSKWKKPTKKRDSVRKMARQSTILLSSDTRAGPPQLARNRSRTPGQGAAGVTPVQADRGRAWRKPHRKQSTIRRMARQASRRDAEPPSGSASPLARQPTRLLMGADGGVSGEGAIAAELVRSDSLPRLSKAASRRQSSRGQLNPRLSRLVTPPTIEFYGIKND